MQDPYNTPTSNQPPQQPYPPQQFVAPPRTDGFAVTAMVLGIIALVTCYFGIILGTIAVVFGHLSLGKIKREPQLGGKGMAIAGLVCGYISIAVTVVFGIIMLTAGSSIMDEMEKQQQTIESGNFKVPSESESIEVE